MAGERHAARLVTVSFALHEGAVLLLQHPADGDRFRGQWNGVGGHVEPGENVLAAARRELREETGVECDDLALRGVVHESGLVGRAHVLFVFLGRARSRALRSAEGLALRWQPLDRLGELPLVHDAAELLARARRGGEVFFATEHYENGDRPAQVRDQEAVHAG